MSSTAKVLAILDLFTSERPIWQPDEINEALGYSRPTGYRYVKELVDTGMLQKVAAGRYALGGRIIALDCQLRQSDPVVLAAGPAMQRVADASGFDAVLTVMFAGPRVIDVHRVNAQEVLQLAYGRGRPRPLFRSGAPKVLLAHLPRGPLVKIYEANAEEIAANGMGQSWAEFRAILTHIRKTGFYRSIGELEQGVGAIAVPVFNPEGECVAALALVGSARRFRPVADDNLLGPLHEATAAIRRSLSALERQRPAAARARSTAKA